MTQTSTILPSNCFLSFPGHVTTAYLLLRLELAVLAGGIGPPLEVVNTLRHSHKLWSPLKRKKGFKFNKQRQINDSCVDSSKKTNLLKVRKKKKQKIE